MQIKRALGGIALAIVLMVPASAALAQSDKAAIDYRQRLMQAMGAHMGSIGDVLKGNVPYGASHVEHHAAAIQDTAMLIASAFEKRVTEGMTDAEPGIWEMMGDFNGKAEALQEQAAKMVEAAQSGDMQAVGAQMRAFGGACGDCHKQYRKPKEESYKNM